MLIFCVCFCSCLFVCLFICSFARVILYSPVRSSLHVIAYFRVRLLVCIYICIYIYIYIYIFFSGVYFCLPTTSTTTVPGLH